jgi:hypothetical protein
MQNLQSALGVFAILAFERGALGGSLFSRFDQLDILLQERIDEFI